MDVLRQMQAGKSGDTVTISCTADDYVPGFIVAGIQEYGITVIVQEPGGTLRLTPFAVSEINASYHYSFGTIRSLLKAETPASSSSGTVSSSAPESATEENTPEEQPESTTSSSSQPESESTVASSSEPAEPSSGEQDVNEPQAGEQSNPAVMILVIVAVAAAAAVGVLIWKRRRS